MRGKNNFERFYEGEFEVGVLKEQKLSVLLQKQRIRNTNGDEIKEIELHSGDWKQKK